MGALDKFLNYMKLNDEEDDEYYDEYYDDDDDEIIESKKSKTSVKEKETEEIPEEKPVKKTLPKVTPMRQSKKIGDSGMEVCVIKPTSVEEEREIAETLLNGRAVVINMEGLNVDIAQRIIDFKIGRAHV